MNEQNTRVVGLVEDDEVIRENLRDFLEANAFEVRAYADRKSAFEAFSEALPDIAILDVTLGAEREAGFTLCGQLRQLTQTMPIVFLTSYDAEANKISGLRMGADDYLSKESSLEFLVVRLETLLTRRRALTEPEDGSPTDIRVGELRVDTERFRVWWKGEEVQLPLTQYWMVAELVKDTAKAKRRKRLDARRQHQRRLKHHRSPGAIDQAAFSLDRRKLRRDSHRARAWVPLDLLAGRRSISGFDNVYAVLGNVRIACNDRHFFNERLRHQESIKWVTMNVG